MRAGAPAGRENYNIAAACRRVSAASGRDVDRLHNHLLAPRAARRPLQLEALAAGARRHGREAVREVVARRHRHVPIAQIPCPAALAAGLGAEAGLGAQRVVVDVADGSGASIYNRVLLERRWTNSEGEGGNNNGSNSHNKGIPLTEPFRDSQTTSIRACSWVRPG